MARQSVIGSGRRNGWRGPRVNPRCLARNRTRVWTKKVRRRARNRATGAKSRRASHCQRGMAMKRFMISVRGMFFFDANEKNREVFTQATDSANLLLVCRQAVVEMAQRVVAEGIQGTREFQTEACK